MASVCGSTLSLMDAGVPIKAPVAGIAMGLVYADGKYTTLTDILGTEDAFGDMDFKVAGTRDFVTALQLDTKIDGLPADVLKGALEQAKVARLEILDVMAEADRRSPRDDVLPTAPKILSFEIPMDKIGEVIGPKGKVINTITQETGRRRVGERRRRRRHRVDRLEGRRAPSTRRSAASSSSSTRPPPSSAPTYTGKVVNVTKFGAFVNILPGRDGLLHISKIGGGKRIDRVEDVLNLGDEVTVRVDDIDNSGQALAERSRATSRRHRAQGGDAPRERRVTATTALVTATTARGAAAATATVATATVARAAPTQVRAPTGGRVVRGHVGLAGEGEFGDLGPPKGRPQRWRWRRRRWSSRWSAAVGDAGRRT